MDLLQNECPTDWTVKIAVSLFKVSVTLLQQRDAHSRKRDYEIYGSSFVTAPSNSCD